MKLRQDQQLFLFFSLLCFTAICSFLAGRASIPILVKDEPTNILVQPNIDPLPSAEINAHSLSTTANPTPIPTPAPHCAEEKKYEKMLCHSEIGDFTTHIGYWATLYDGMCRPLTTDFTLYQSIARWKVAYKLHNLQSKSPNDILSSIIANNSLPQLCDQLELHLPLEESNEYHNLLMNPPIRGIFDPLSETYQAYTRDDCYYYLYSKSEARQCLRNRSIALLGDSVLDEFACFVSRYLAMYYAYPNNSVQWNALEKQSVIEINDDNILLRCHHKHYPTLFEDKRIGFKLSWHSTEGSRFGKQNEGLNAHRNLSNGYWDKFQSWIGENDIIIWNSLLHDMVRNDYTCYNVLNYTSDLNYALSQLSHLMSQPQHKNGTKQFFWWATPRVFRNSGHSNGGYLENDFMCYALEALNTLDRHSFSKSNFRLIDTMWVKDKARVSNPRYGDGIHSSHFIWPNIESEMFLEMSLQIMLNSICN